MHQDVDGMVRDHVRQPFTWTDAVTVAMSLLAMALLAAAIWAEWAWPR